VANAPACFKLSLSFAEGIAPELRTVIFERLGSDTGRWQETIRTAKTEKSDDSSLHFLWKQGTQGWVLALLDYRLNGETGQGLRRYEGPGSSSACGVIDKQQWLIGGFGAEQNSDRQFAQQIFKIQKGGDSRTTFQINSNYLSPSSVRFFMGNSTKELPPQKLRELAQKVGAQWQPHRQNEGSVAPGTEEKAFSKPKETPPVAESPSTGASVAAEKMVKTAVAFPAPPLRHLDSPVGDFVGRKKEEDILISRLSNFNQVGIGMIDGMPGVGKTQLALRVARELGHQFSGHQLVVRLRSGGGKPSDPRDALSKVVRSLKGPGLELPLDLDDLRQMYLHALSGTKSFIFVDNASESSEVEPLVPPDGCAMVVTSRATLALHRDVSVRVHVDELLPDQAAVLLIKICSRIPLTPDVAEQICRYCGYLPLAIRASGNLLDTTFGLGVCRT